MMSIDLTYFNYFDTHRVMSNSTVKLQVPLDKSLRDRVAKHARKQGFSSIQDFTRVLFNTVLENNLRFTLVDESGDCLSLDAKDLLQ